MGPVRTVYFDKSCPLCSAEISHYQRLSANTPVRFIDASCSKTDLGADLPRTEAMNRFHVRDEHGALHSGAAGFALLWSALPGWRHLATVARAPGVLVLMEISYRGFLYVRPLIARVFRMAQKRAGQSS
jgi:predicted DCC family thiol-disulfide oxidoreductase YuxK